MSELGRSWKRTAAVALTAALSSCALFDRDHQNFIDDVEKIGNDFMTAAIAPPLVNAHAQNAENICYYPEYKTGPGPTASYKANGKMQPLFTEHYAINVNTCGRRQFGAEFTTLPEAQKAYRGIMFKETQRVNDFLEEYKQRENARTVEEGSQEITVTPTPYG